MRATAEAESAARRLREIADKALGPGDIAILLRSYSHADAYAAALSRGGCLPSSSGAADSLACQRSPSCAP